MAPRFLITADLKQEKGVAIASNDGGRLSFLDFFRRIGPERYNPIGFGEGKRAKHDGIDHTEDNRNAQMPNAGIFEIVAMTPPEAWKEIKLDTRRSNVALRLQSSLLEEARKVGSSEGVALNQFIKVAVAETVGITNRGIFSRACRPCQPPPSENESSSALEKGTRRSPGTTDSVVTERMPE